MPDAPQTLGEAFKAKLVSVDQLEAAVETVMRDPTTDHLRIADNIVIDPAAAIRASGHATGMLARSDVKAESKRSAVKSAMLLARVKAL